MEKIYYDICTRIDAINTLSMMTGKSYEKCFEFFEMFKNQLDDDKVKKQFIWFLLDCDKQDYLKMNNIEFVMTHVTSSDNKCKDILENGILSNFNIYLDLNSQLRRFLDKYKVKIDLKNRSISHNGLEYFYENEEHLHEEIYINQALNQLFFDYEVCGFKSINSHIYSCINHCPELIKKISEFFLLNMEGEWISSSKSYVVKSIVKNDEIAQGMFKDNINDLLFEAYKQANKESQSIIRLNRGCTIKKENILQVKSLYFWVNNH